MTEKKTKASKLVKEEKINKDTIDVSGGQKLALQKTFKFEWDTVFRVLGSITGIAGVSTALFFLFGYFYFLGAYTATDIPIQLFFTQPNELILLEGINPFIVYIFNVAVLFLIYFLSRFVIRLVIKSAFKRVKRLSTAIGFGVILYLIAIAIGLQGVNSYELNLTRTRYFLISAAYIFPAFEILHVVNEEFGNWGRNVTKKIKDIYIKSLLYFFGAIKSLFLIYGIIFLLIVQSINTVNRGQAAYCNKLIRLPTSVVLFSDHSMGLEGEISSEGIYIYEGYYLLYFDKDTYYLYREIEPQKLKPKSVYVINSSNFNAIKIQFVKAPTDWNFTKSCSDFLIK